MGDSEPKLNSTKLALEDEGPGWIVTYADLVTLLLVFFVMLFSISTLDLNRFRQLAAAMQKSFGLPVADIATDLPDVAPPQPLPPPPDIQPQDSHLPEILKEELDQELVEEVRQAVKERRLGENIVILEEKKRLTITIEGQILFNAGQAALNETSLPVLDEIARILNNYADYRVNIKGHTDDTPISTAQFPSNWELSAVRATTVLRYMIYRGVDPGRLTATGYSDLLPIAPNDTPENRARNRRVEFVLEKEK